MIVIGMVYFSFICFWNLSCTIEHIKMCDCNQKCFGSVWQTSWMKLFYITLTFDSEVSLHSWLLWPTVRCLVASATSNRDDQQSTYPWCLECQINHFFAAFGLGTDPIAPRAATAVAATAAAMRILRHVWRFFHSMYTSVYVHTCMPIGTLIR